MHVLALLLGLIVLVLVVLLYKSYSNERTLKNELIRLNRELNTRVVEYFNHWKQTECQNIRRQEHDAAMAEARRALEQWRKQSEELIRQDAIKRSQAVVSGKVAEHLVPFMSGFDFNPRDVRFLGSPIDIIIFDGLSDGNVRKIVFGEVKNGESALSTRQRQVKDAIEQKKVYWEEIRT